MGTLQTFVNQCVGRNRASLASGDESVTECTCAGELIRVMDRGTGSMKGLLSTVLFSIGPALFDVLAASAYLSTQQPWMALIVLVSITIYVPVTIYITEYRGSLRRDMNSQDNKKSSRVRPLGT